MTSQLRKKKVETTRLNNHNLFLLLVTSLYKTPYSGDYTNVQKCICLNTFYPALITISVLIRLQWTAWESSEDSDVWSKRWPPVHVHGTMSAMLRMHKVPKDEFIVRHDDGVEGWQKIRMTRTKVFNSHLLFLEARYLERFTVQNWSNTSTGSLLNTEPCIYESRKALSWCIHSMIDAKMYHGLQIRGKVH